MFRGTYHNSVDDKGRTVLPARLREQIHKEHETPLVLTLGFDKCLYLYPLDVWKKIEEKLSSLDSLSPEVRLLQRTLLRATDEIQIDAQGRIMISPILRKEAGIAKSVKFELAAAPFTVELSGTTAHALTFVVTPD